ncbi:MAG: hypothetical protein ACYSYW_02665 [Planctomycetota bacterium]
MLLGLAAVMLRKRR